MNDCDVEKSIYVQLLSSNLDFFREIASTKIFEEVSGPMGCLRPTYCWCLKKNVDATKVCESRHFTCFSFCTCVPFCVVCTFTVYVNLVWNRNHLNQQPKIMNRTNKLQIVYVVCISEKKILFSFNNVCMYDVTYMIT